MNLIFTDEGLHYPLELNLVRTKDWSSISGIVAVDVSANRENRIQAQDMVVIKCGRLFISVLLQRRFVAMGLPFDEMYHMV